MVFLFSQDKFSLHLNTGARRIPPVDSISGHIPVYISALVC